MSDSVWQCKLCGCYDFALIGEEKFSPGCRIVICRNCAKKIREKYIEKEK